MSDSPSPHYIYEYYLWEAVKEAERKGKRYYTRMYCSSCDKVIYTKKILCPICGRRMEKEYSLWKKGNKELRDRKAEIID